MDINGSLINAVRYGNLEKTREIITTYSLSYSRAWSDGYVLLLKSTKGKHTQISKLLLNHGSKVNSKTSKKKLTDTPLHFAALNGDKDVVGMLIERGALMNIKNTTGTTPFHNAVDNNRIEIVNMFLNSGVNVNDKKNDGRTPLHIASERGYLQICEKLLNHGANVNFALRTNGYTPLHLAAEKGIEPIVDLLLEKNANIDSKSKINVTPLFLAVKNRHAKVVELLLQKGANVDAQNKKGKTILNLAVETGLINIVETILKHKPNKNIKSNKDSLKFAIQSSKSKYVEIATKLFEYGLTISPDVKLLQIAITKGYHQILESLVESGHTEMQQNLSNSKCYLLHLAFKFKQREVASLLIKYGVNVNLDDNYQRTPIFYAIENQDIESVKLLLSQGAIVKNRPEILITAIKKGSLEMVDILLKNGADANAFKGYNRTPLHFAASSCELLLSVQTKNKAEIAQLLINNKANINAPDTSGLTPLHEAVRNENIDVVKILLNNKANIVKDRFGMTPLHYAARNGSIKTFKILLNHGADINSKMVDGTTVLSITTEEGHQDLLEMILENGCDVDLKGHYNQTALHVAAHNGDVELVQTLLKYGADINAKDKLGRTALSIASRERNDQVVLTLLENGCDINDMSKNNNTPLESIKNAFYAFQDFDFCYDNDSEDEYCPSDLDYYDYSDSIDPFGSDYDDDSDSDYYHSGFDTFSSIQIAEILQQHVIMNKVAELFAGDKNFESIQTDHRMEFQIECVKEVEKMKITKIANSNVTFYDILIQLNNQVATYLRNESIVKVLHSGEYKNQFPIYAGKITMNFKKGLRRRELLDQGIVTFQLMSNYFFDLPYNCSEKILSYLLDKDLRNLIGACKPININNDE